MWATEYLISVVHPLVTTPSLPAVPAPALGGRLLEARSMQFAPVFMPTSPQHREEERLRQEQERREKERQQAQFLQRTFGLAQEEVPLEDFSCALQVWRPSLPNVPAL